MPKEAAALASAVSSALRSGSTAEHVEIELASAGEPAGARHLVGRVHPIRDGDGGIVAAGAIIEEVTQHKETQYRNAHFAAVIESSGDPIVSFSPDGVIRSWNPAAERLYGFASHEAVGRHVTAVYMAHAKRRQKSSSYAPCRAKHSRSKPRVVAPFRRDCCVSHGCANPLCGRENHRPSAITRDIRERKRAEAALAQSVAQLELAVDPCADRFCLLRSRAQVRAGQRLSFPPGRACRRRASEL